MSTRWRQESGLSLVEVTIILSVMAILAGVLAPVGQSSVEMSRVARVREDLQALGQAVLAFTDSTGFSKFTVDGTKQGPRVDLLVGNGAIPSDLSGQGSAAWQMSPEGSGKVDYLDRHLVTNDPGGQAGHAYAVPTRFEGPGWRGAYLATSVESDPWGSRYMVNVKHMVSSGAAGPWYDVFAYSAGANRIVETPFSMDGAIAGNDDFVLVIFRHPLATTGAIDGGD